MSKTSFLIVIFFLAILALNFVFPIFKVPFFPKKDFNLGLDLRGGIHLLYQVELSEINFQEKELILGGLKEILERRIDLLGVKEPVVQVQGERIIVELAGILDPQKAIEEIGKLPFLEFREQINEEFSPTPLTGRYLKRASVALDEFSEPVVILEFDKEGAKIFEEITQRNIGKPLAIFIDGNLISSPVVKEKISSGRAQISGKFTLEEAKKLAENLNAGALPAPIKLLSWNLVGPTLGVISFEKIFKTGILSFFSISLFLIFLYRLPGILASFALIIYGIFVLATFKIISLTLTLSGIAGFLLSLGMAVDANILIFERMKEERKKGKTIKKAIEDAKQRAWPAIRDGNLTTILVGLVLFAFGTSFVKGFATTLLIGIFWSIFSGVYLAPALIEIFGKEKLEKLKILWP